MSKRPFIAAGLQVVPLVVAALWAGELTLGWFRWGGVFLYFWLVVFSWGLGNLYLRRWGRFLATWVAGFAATAVAALVSITIVVRCGPTADSLRCSGFLSAAPLVLVVAGGTLFCAVDAWRLASGQNAVSAARRRRRIRR